KDLGPKSTGQRLVVVNDAPVAHNFKFQSVNVNLKPGAKQAFDFSLEDAPIKAECSIHGWMSAFIWTFDHPYAMATRDDGKFEFWVPAGVELELWGWHEARQDWGVLRKINVKDGETLNVGDITVK